MSMEDIVSIGANCVLRTRRNGFFLLTEIEVEAGNVEIEEFVFIRISTREANTLIRAGVMECRVLNNFDGFNIADVECVFIVDGEAFAVFDVEVGGTDEAVLVAITLGQARSLLNRGARRCTVINRRRF